MKTEVISNDELKKFLIEHGIQPSFQRIKILEYMMTHRTHPDVETVYRDLHSEIPTLSMTTVYNTLKLFTKKKITTALTLEGTEIRYDFAPEPHMHFKCKVCGKIYDVPLPKKHPFGEFIDGHKIESEDIYLFGVCKKCLGNSN
ncbi:MAG: transcriptional repressor [Deltaproteobacteria bacterium]|nr:MAG: transcriptional repressor [Deltaproteobacteria bacterium]